MGVSLWARLSVSIFLVATFGIRKEKFLTKKDFHCTRGQSPN